MTEIEQARVEAEIAIAEAEAKIKILNDLRWSAAEREAGPEAGFIDLLRELENLPDVHWPVGCFYHPDGDYLEVYWRKPGDGPVVMRHRNSLVETFHAVDEEGNLSVGPVGCRIIGAKAVLERANVYLTPDPPNPSPAVLEARAAGVCRVCREPIDLSGSPAGTADRFASMVHPEKLVFNCGEEYAHQSCLNRERDEREGAA